MLGASIKVCLSCNERHTACHDTCKKYIEEKKEHDQICEKMKAARRANVIHDQLQWKRTNRGKKR